MRSRWGIVALALLSASAFALSVQGGRWWSVLNVEIGPFGSRRCFGTECGPAGLGWIGAGDGWARLGMATWAGALVSMAVLVVLAAALAAKRVPRLVAKMALSAIATATLVGGLFAVKFPGIDGAAVDRGLPLFGVAVALGVAASVLTLRMRPA